MRRRVWPFGLEPYTGYILLLPALALVATLVVSLLLIGDSSLRLLDRDMFRLGENYSLGNYETLIERPVYLRIIAKTLLAAVIVTLVTLALAMPYAYLMVRTPSPTLRKFLLISLFLPFFLGQVIRAYGWLIILGKQGLLNSALSGIGLPAVELIYTFPGVLLGLVQYMLPFAVLLLAPALTAISEELELASMSLGARPWSTFRHVILPLAKPGWVAAGVVVFTLTLTDFAMPEIMGGGAALFDMDGDGDLDLYLVNGAATPGSDLPETPRNALYENRGGSFVDIGATAGVDDTAYGMGLCVGDVDGDGRLDLFVTNYGPDRLYRNLGPGPEGSVHFEEIGARAGVDGGAWGTNCAFADLDLDGDLDLYVANYVNFRYEANPRCGDPARGISSYCRPEVFDGQPDYLYINQLVDPKGESGPLHFREEGATRGIARGAEENGFGVVISDLDGDRAPDILVANDGTPNRFYRNDGRGYFQDLSLASGFAFDREGASESSMGLEVADLDLDGRPEALVTNYAFETNTLYSMEEAFFLTEVGPASGLARPSYLSVGWGVGFFDQDNDGDLDMAVANGHVMDNIHLFEERLEYPQANFLFENQGLIQGQGLLRRQGEPLFRRVGAEGGEVWSTRKVSRALAVGDWDNDGRLDLLITNTNAGVDLLHNLRRTDHHWVGLTLRGTYPNRSAIGARVELYRGNSLFGSREVRSGGSLLAQHDLRVHFGLGGGEGDWRLRILWPGGQESWHGVDALDTYRTIHQDDSLDQNEMRAPRQ